MRMVSVHFCGPRVQTRIKPDRRQLKTANRRMGEAKTFSRFFFTFTGKSASRAEMKRTQRALFSHALVTPAAPSIWHALPGASAFWSFL